MHEVFETFFERWQSAGAPRRSRRPISARPAHVFAEVVEASLARLSETEAGARANPAARFARCRRPWRSGVPDGGRTAVAVVERLLEHRLKGEFVVDTSAGPRTVSLSGKADRIDLLADGTFRVDRLQARVAAEPGARAAAADLRHLRRAAPRGAPRPALDARRGGVPGVQGTQARRARLSISAERPRTEVLADAQQRLVATRSMPSTPAMFPPTPDDVYRCETCSYAAVCRKDYVGDV